MAIDRTGSADDWTNAFTEPADHLRRSVLKSLQDAGVALSLADLAVELARGDVEPDVDVWERAECLWIELYHNHVPALEAAGLVEYHRERRTVSLCSGAVQQFDESAGATVPA